MSKTKMKLVIANKIQSLRAEQNISQQHLAEKVEVTRATIISIEKGNYNPSLELAFRLSRFFSKDISEVFNVEEENE